MRVYLSFTFLIDELLFLKDNINSNIKFEYNF